MNNTEIAGKIIALREADLCLREKLLQKGRLNAAGYAPEMAALHTKNADTLDEIIEQIGYPSADKVGKEASQAAWLVIQHAIGNPDFMRKCLRLLEEAVRKGQGDPKHLAYLSDRIATLEGKPQLYGTQFDWSENGKLQPQPFDSTEAVNRRRLAVGLHTIEEQTRLIQQRAEAEGQSPPEDWEQRKQEMDTWRASVGWIAGK